MTIQGLQGSPMTTPGPPGRVRVPFRDHKPWNLLTVPEGLLASGAEQSGGQSLETRHPGCGGRMVWQ